MLTRYIAQTNSVTVGCISPTNKCFFFLNFNVVKYLQQENTLKYTFSSFKYYRMCFILNYIHSEQIVLRKWRSFKPQSYSCSINQHLCLLSNFVYVKYNKNVITWSSCIQIISKVCSICDTYIYITFFQKYWFLTLVYNLFLLSHSFILIFILARRW